ncbi:Os08g0335200 [Oryza sativa Japonica Group]|uniref:Os08g0335200 protein n=1 Tax=Oryza sativa subsp. japonica TaxID=39947 RepID=Q0J6C5_ORYSJ|nr:Os08g0335200 [Oryza sativa Japonica Group]|eukprot:NP_001061576.1 Os08g0335200 [Oryza sativa Japonica Group]
MPSAGWFVELRPMAKEKAVVKLVVVVLPPPTSSSQSRTSCRCATRPALQTPRFVRLIRSPAWAASPMNTKFFAASAEKS